MNALAALRDRWTANVLLSALAFIFAIPNALLADDDYSEVWQALSSGEHVALLRHALAPGTGDPAHFDPGDCATQRNLSSSGRKQAIQIGERMRANGIDQAMVFTSEWCRCRDTAKLLALGPVEPLPLLNSFFAHRERQEEQTEGLRNWLMARLVGVSEAESATMPMVLVTHQVNITALTGVYPRSGELVVIGFNVAGDVRVLGTIHSEKL